MSLTLYNLTQNYLTLQQMVEDTDTPPQALVDTLEAIQDELPIKVENTAKVIRWQKLNIESVKKEIERLSKIQKTLESKVSNLESYLQTNMTVLSLPQVKTPTLTVDIVKNPAAVDVTDATLIPAKFKKRTITETVDKTAIKEAISKGEAVPGATLTQGQRLRIR